MTTICTIVEDGHDLWMTECGEEITTTSMDFTFCPHCGKRAHIITIDELRARMNDCPDHLEYTAMRENGEI